MTSKYYVRTNEGAYLQGHANPTPLWTNKVEDAEELDAEIALKFINKVEDTLRTNVFTYLEPVTLEPIVDEPYKEFDEVTHPSHYTQYSFEAIDVIDEVAPTYPVEIIAEMANVIKYALRAPHKGQLKKDLGKIIWYTQRAIDNLEKSEKYDYED